MNDLAGYAAIAITLVGGAVTWGSTSNQMTSYNNRLNSHKAEIEALQASQKAEVAALQAEIADHSVHIAVSGQKLDDIIIRLERIENKMDDKNQHDNRREAKQDRGQSQ
jgi:septal ring factor EnvC (AmiA/AmiB activator)